MLSIAFFFGVILPKASTTVNLKNQNFPTPDSRLPTPYSLFPIPYSLFPIPYSLLPTPYSLLPTPFPINLQRSIISTYAVDNSCQLNLS
ncbi:MAG: hypothetical protein F6J90_14355 [Moorea sp. SIOASIH]|uniref:hypothetical protein n=1 Tax=Moorena sp. SIOASIH TaxID=2607817 RepID=UPI0013B99911|nr:hypothetical protein [Moorena sp. SIOASIH]NEO37443.1 hypothetical protein [Moorena sp. SIOASIH]